METVSTIYSQFSFSSLVLLNFMLINQMGLVQYGDNVLKQKPGMYTLNLSNKNTVFNYKTL